MKEHREHKTHSHNGILYNNLKRKKWALFCGSSGKATQSTEIPYRTPVEVLAALLLKQIQANALRNQPEKEALKNLGPCHPCIWETQIEF